MTTLDPHDLNDVPALLFKQIAKRVTKAEFAIQSPSGVHEVRKRLKEIRALLRLLRDVVGKRRLRRADRAFGDAGRPLTAARDADVMIETLDALRCAASKRAATLASLRPTLLAERRRVRRRVRRESAAPAELARVRAAIADAGQRVAAWPDESEHGGWSRVHEPFVDSYRAARRALRRAIRLADDDAAWHACRKHVKRLLYQLDFFEPLAPEAIGALTAQATAIADALGEAHDLAVLIAFVRKSDAATIGDDVSTLIDERGRTRQNAAVRIGEELFAERPRAFARRLHVYWRAFVES